MVCFLENHYLNFNTNWRYRFYDDDHKLGDYNGKENRLKKSNDYARSLKSFSLSGVIRLTKYVIMITFCRIDGRVVIIHSIYSRFWIKNGIYYSIFHAVSAFCNAGFDIMGGFKSLTDYAT